ncbi:hypothetical protein [Archangium lansingense]|uniref:Delta-60 repeat protein n=1 Tax=Archangium lansingense TaxID=2995310 RepID=A0ABT4AB48_9BACT|nr:hypothetical protein [Archangium lansinium]MCY1078142.1 hypothetical protein [Archangium lansinium]
MKRQGPGYGRWVGVWLALAGAGAWAEAPKSVVPMGVAEWDTPTPRAGTLDPSFGSGGVVTTDFSGGAEQIEDLAIQRDGRIVTVGSTRNTLTNNTNVALMRYLEDGRLDPSFGEGGRVTTDFGGTDVARAVAIQPDGKLVIAGFTTTSAPRDVFLVARYLKDGRLDTSFGTGGWTTIDFGGHIVSLAHDVGIQPNGRIVVAGLTLDARSSYDFAIARLRKDGSLDPSFGSGGTVNVDFSGGADFGLAMSILPGCRIVVAGSAAVPGSGDDYAAIRLRPDGTLDPSFGTSGRTTVDFLGADDDAWGVAIQPGGKVVLAGRVSRPGESHFAFGLTRLDSEGRLDTRFGDGGRTLTDFSRSSDSAMDVAVQSDGRIVAAGIVGDDVRGGVHFGIARYDKQGRLDPSFGTGGLVTSDFGLSPIFGDQAFAVAVDEDDRILVGGASVVGFPEPRDLDASLARYLGGKKRH